jgi:hypothetical protein
MEFAFRVAACYDSGMDSKRLASRVRESGLNVFQRMFRAVDLVQERLNRACKALHAAQVHSG